VSKAPKLGRLFAALGIAAILTGASNGKDPPVKHPHPVPGAKVNTAEGDLEIRSCAEAAVSAANLLAANGFRFQVELPQRTWEAGLAGDRPDELVFKEAAGNLKGCPWMGYVSTDPRDVVELLVALLNDSRLGLVNRLNGDGSKVFKVAAPQEESGSPVQPSLAPPPTSPVQANPAPLGPSPGQPGPAPPTASPVQANPAPPGASPGQLSPAPPGASSGQPSPAPPTPSPGQPSPAPVTAIVGQQQQDLTARLTGQMKQIESRLDTLNGSVSSALNRGMLLPYLQLVLVGLAFVTSTFAFTGTRRLNRKMPEPQLLNRLRDDLARSRQRGSQAEALASETQNELNRISTILRALRSEIGSLRSAPEPEQERRARLPMTESAPRSMEPVLSTPPDPARSARQTLSDDEWCSAYNDALKNQDLDGLASRNNGVWTRIQDRSTWPARLVRSDHPPERGLLDGFLYIPNGRSGRGWVFPGPNYYADRSAISSGQLRLEAFSGIFEARPGESYVLRRPATAVEGGTGIAIEKPGLIEL
jgi:hypothetical protein